MTPAELLKRDRVTLPTLAQRMLRSCDDANAQLSKLRAIAAENRAILAEVEKEITRQAAVADFTMSVALEAVSAVEKFKEDEKNELAR